jgi:D-glycero-D-manno-heptose 1,7-bisphosphate phosphatase
MNKGLDLVILCGGRGKRLGNLTKNTPKPLIKVNNKQFIDYIIQFYQKYNFNKIFLVTSYKAKKFEKYNKKYFNAIPSICIKEKNPKGTGGALNELKKKIKNDFLLVNGDSYLDFNFNNFIKIRKKYSGKMILIKNKNYHSNTKLSSLNLNKKKEVIFSDNNSKYMNAGIYLFKRGIFDYISNKNISLEDQVLPELIKKKKIEGIKEEGTFIDIGTKNNLRLAGKIFKKKNISPAVFFDRDGVLNEDNGYVYKYSDFIWKKGVLKLLRYLSKKNFYLFIVTNQSGIGRGYFTTDSFMILHKKIKSFLLKKKIYFHDVKFCPHHPKFGLKEFKKNCACRKPGNKMLKEIITDWKLDVKKSVMVGDKTSDKLASIKTNVNFFYSDRGYKKKIINYLNNFS